MFLFSFGFTFKFCEEKNRQQKLNQYNKLLKKNNSYHSRQKCIDLFNGI